MFVWILFVLTIHPWILKWVDWWLLVKDSIPKTAKEDNISPFLFLSLFCEEDDITIEDDEDYNLSNDEKFSFFVNAMVDVDDGDEHSFTTVFMDVSVSCDEASLISEESTNKDYIFSKAKSYHQNMLLQVPWPKIWS